MSAFADGRLRVLPGDADRPFQLEAGPEGIDRSLVERLKAVKPRLVPIIKRMDEAVAQRATALSETLAAALRGWSKGTVARHGRASERWQANVRYSEHP